MMGPMTNNTTLTAETITTAQIKALRSEAQAAGDYAQVDICDRALAKDFSAAVRRTLAKKSIIVTGSTWLPASGGDYANGERGYMLNDNGTSKIRNGSQVIEIAK